MQIILSMFGSSCYSKYSYPKGIAVLSLQLITLQLKQTKISIFINHKNRFYGNYGKVRCMSNLFCFVCSYKLLETIDSTRNVFQHFTDSEVHSFFGVGNNGSHKKRAAVISYPY